MFLPENARQLLFTARDKHMNCKPPNFPKLVLKLSSCGTFKYFLSDKLLVVVFPETSPGANDGYMIYAFFKRDFSNFSALQMEGVVCDDRIRQALLNIRFDCGEQFFKMMCAILHVDPVTGENLNIMQAILDANEPSDAKKAPNQTKGFNKLKWDGASLDAMTAARMNMNRDPIYRDRNLEIAQIAKDHGVKLVNVKFMEATEITPAVEAVAATETTPAVKAKPEYPADNVWGSAVGVKRLFEYISEHGRSEALVKYMADPICVNQSEDCLTIDGVRLGKNKLGVAMEVAFRAVVGEDFEGLGETMPVFIERGLKRRFFDCLEVAEAEVSDVAEPEAKRARSGSDDRVDLVCTEVLGRCVSDAVMEAEASTQPMEEAHALSRTYSCSTGSA